ncbi:MAG: DsrE/DsrF-like family protein [Methanoregula sp. PtaU1.Bin051]|nr:MAG: DsrE/DsrF-like family protein [Methanoregula sp. PtaU1.Bin051]
MTSNFFLFSEPLTAERLSWITESLKYYFVNLYPDALRHPSRAESPFFAFFITDNALYSLHEEETLRIWDIILSLPSVWLFCNRRELDLRGLSVSPLKMKYPGTVFDRDKEAGSRSFWEEAVRFCRKLDPDMDTFGYLQISSPYMNRSCQNSLECLHTAAREGLSPELYVYMDGIHVTHAGQRPIEFINIGDGFQDLAEIAREKGLSFQLLASERSSAARGYSTWDDGKGTVISACTIEPCRIRNLKAIIDRFRRSHVILGESAGTTDISHAIRAGQEPWEKKEPTPPSLVIVITRPPYGTEHTLGALSFAIAGAHYGITTRVIFLEDGIYSLTGTHNAEPDDVFFNIQEVIDAAGGNENLEFYAYLPSLQERNIQKNKKLNAVLDIGPGELTTLLFSPPRGVISRHQRILFF